MLGPRKYLGDSDPRVIDEKISMPEWVCDKLVLEHGYNTWPAWAHERVVQKLHSKHS